MKITVQSSKSVKPVYGSCGRRSSVASFATADFVPLTVFDKVTVDVYVSRIYFFRPPAPPSSAMEAGLATALAEYREWAGRLGVDAASGNRGILLNDAGARFVEAAADVALDSVMPWEPTPETTNLLHPNGDDGGADELMLVQVTRFACGSFAVSTTAHLRCTDGPAVRSFVVAWGQATRGAAVDPVPVHDRVSFFVPRDPPRVEFEHRGAEFKPHGDSQAGTCNTSSGDQVVVVHRAHFSREMISELRTRASSSDGGTSRPHTTLQCVVAHLWQCITKARRIDADSSTATELHIAVNGRARMRRPRVPDAYTGNAVLWARPTATAGELMAMPLRQVVELIRQEVSRIDDGYFRSFIDFASSGAVEKERLVPTADPSETAKSPHVAVYSVLGSPFHEIGFDAGGGQPFFFMPSYVPVEGLVAVVPSFCDDGSVDAYVSLFGHTVDDFKTCCYSLAAAGEARL
ncbi:agmatine coumaroyltransferase-2-like [Miscanthus floridulus]|uniref:agmatine coumaroyltransferase-2-like n=1 Tax=Miscanthus floridulus TaxID=154761 RepID=UPI0034576B54